MKFFYGGKCYVFIDHISPNKEQVIRSEMKDHNGHDIDKQLYRLLFDSVLKEVDRFEAESIVNGNNN